MTLKIIKLLKTEKKRLRDNQSTIDELAKWFFYENVKKKIICRNFIASGFKVLDQNVMNVINSLTNASKTRWTLKILRWK